MKKITRRLFLIAFIFAIISAGAIFIYLESLNEEEVVIETTEILVAAVDIPPRTKIEKDMITTIVIPIDGEYGNFINDETALIGQYTKHNVYMNERFHKEMLVENVEDELSLKIKGDNRAVSIKVSGESGVSDLIKPSDFVDILVYLPELKEGDRIVRPNIAKMILQNIEVLGIDQNLYRDTQPRLEIPPTYQVTLSVPVLELEKLVLAEDIGDIKLALRPIEKDYIHQTEGVIWEELLLDDFNQMKDMFPQYEIKTQPEEILSSESYSYEKYYYYTIQYGDTLRKISLNFYGDEEKYKLLQMVNKIQDMDNIVAGTGIKIPVLIEEDNSHETIRKEVSEDTDS